MREEHMAEVYAAKNAIGEAQDALANLIDKSEYAVTMTAAATGGHDCNSEAGQNAFGFVAGLEQTLEELAGRLAKATAELDRYAGGF